MSDEVAIKVEHVSKDFVLPHEKVNSVKGMFTSLAKGRTWKTKETQHALRDISFEVKKGEFFGIVGRNGSGKSTLLKMLAGIYQPTKGKIYTKGKLVPFIELGVGFNPELTGRENVYLNGAMMGFSHKQVDAMYDDVVAFAELDKFMDQKLKNYSSGMQVRLAFSVAIKAETDVLLVDEVLAVGDADFQRKCFQYFEQLKRNKKTVVFVSHDMNAVQQYCDRAVLIDKSELVVAGKALKVANAYTKMFLEQRTTNDGGDNENGEQRWGDGLITYASPTAKVVGETNSVILIEARLKAKKYIRKPKLGFSLKNFAGAVLFGTNTAIVRHEVSELHPGQEVKISWEAPNILNEGEYSIDLTVSYEGVVADWWEGATSVRIVREERTPYLVNPPAAFSMVEEDKAG